MNAEEILVAVVEKKTPAERAAYLDGACGQDAALRSLVEGLLKAHEEAGSFLQQPLFEPSPTVDQVPNPEKPGAVIGPYKLLQQIGEGGMGTVWMAEQTQPVQRKVALKLIKSGMDSRQVIARFEAERQALALMDHPNIARVLDAGTTSEVRHHPFSRDAESSQRSAPLGDCPALRCEDSASRLNTADRGRPYFVMELVKGVPITRYCDEHHLTPRQRLELFVPVCQAVQHAHQKGIIHRDLKPSNVMVCLYDGKPVPKVIDFGIAKAAGPRLTDKTLFTELGQVVGTLEYMSPEQAELNQLDIDTRSDIYSLGVLLYELLTGTTPLERKRFKEVAFLEVLRLIREEESPRPSTRLSTTEGLPSIAANRGLEPKKLSGLMRGELDWIVMKTLEKDRNRRYETANGFAADVQRYLNDEPVQACPPSALYRFRKFARRHKRGVAMAVVVSLAALVALGAVAGSVGWVLNDRQVRREALRERVDRKLDEAWEWYSERGNVSEALAAARRAEEMLGGSEGGPDLRARLEKMQVDLEMVASLEKIRLERTIAQIDLQTGFWDGVKRHEAEFGKYGIAVLDLEPEEAVARIKASPIRAALVLGLDDWAGMFGQSHPRWRKLVAIARDADDDDWCRRCRDVLLGGDWKALRRLGADPRALDRRPAALVLLGDSLAKHDLRAGVQFLERVQLRYPGDFWVNHTLAWHLLGIKPSRAAEVIGLFRAALAIRPDSPGALVNLGNVLAQSGQMDAAVAAYQEAIRRRPDHASAYPNLGQKLSNMGRLDEAVAIYKKGLAIRPLEPRLEADLLVRLGAVLARKGQIDEAIAAFQKALAVEPESGPRSQAAGSTIWAVPGLPRGYIRGRAYEGLGLAFWTKKQWDEAIAAFQKAIETDPRSAARHYGLGVALQNKGRVDEAIAAYQKALALEPNHASASCNLGVLLFRTKKFDEAVRVLRTAARLAPNNVTAHWVLGSALIAGKGDHVGAAAAFREAVRCDPSNPTLALEYGDACLHSRDEKNALGAYRRAIDLQPEWGPAYRRLARLLATATDLELRDLAEAIRLARKAVELLPNDRDCRNTLGIAYYRAGNWKAAVASLTAAIEVGKGGSAFDWFFLAMAHGRLGNKEEARRHYDLAAQWLKKFGPQLGKLDNANLRRFHAEAAEVLGLEAPPGKGPPE